MQWNAIDISTLCYAAAVATAIFGILVAYCSYKAWASEKTRKKSRALQRNTSEGWAPTGRIDFAGGATTGNFVLRVEETQVVKGIGGTEYRDVRWRTPTLEEVKAVVVAYHAQRNLVMRASYIVSSANRYAWPHSEVTDAEQESRGTIELHSAPLPEHALGSSSAAA